ncbi:hypothetical protein PY254_05855 [Rhodanobacter sp. AS-Z3]|uniref:hypothetical protein n=1 Tax=Rhodanobacter sp. AS-Z3 TaxID=3031330 RepID=UPI002479B802|nr:hypothetical protein [Rhodanobacter sp. AS-Z3]WEN16190.1 hypothetical protein PY254_05855 [Rhodanobacter sp. AS-Z3]
MLLWVIGGFIALSLGLGYWAADQVTAPAPAAAPVVAKSASTLLHDFDGAIASEHLEVAQMAGNRLISEYPTSSEAAQIKPKLSDIKAKLHAQFFAQQEQDRATKAKAEAERAAQIRKQKEASATAKAAKQGEIKKALAGFTKKHDEVQGVTFYFAPGVRMNSTNTYFGLYLAVPDDSDVAGLRWKFQYGGDDWLFIQSLILNVDGKSLPALTFPYGAIDRDNGSGDVWEWHDEFVQSSSVPLFLQLALAKKVIVRFEGRQYYKDHILTTTEKTGMLKIINAYTAMNEGGK